jgi:hypothetical protein
MTATSTSSSVCNGKTGGRSSFGTSIPSGSKAAPSPPTTTASVALQGPAPPAGERWRKPFGFVHLVVFPSPITFVLLWVGAAQALLWDKQLLVSVVSVSCRKLIGSRFWLLRFSCSLTGCSANRLPARPVHDFQVSSVFCDPYDQWIIDVQHKSTFLRQSLSINA